MKYDHITTSGQLERFCKDIAAADAIGFDTEFVSEDSYRPQLCLIQVAAGGRLGVIDAIALRDLRVFWELVAADGHETIVHAGREELLFCVDSVGRPPGRLFDLQIAAALVGNEFPAGYGALMQKLLGQRLEKGETRTDWRRRPLSHQQIEYALDDVRYLEPMRNKLMARLERMGRVSWLEFEMAAWQESVAATRGSERWWKVSGASGLSPRSLAIVRELWRWRESEAERRDSPPRRVLRDDLIVELAKRRTADVKQMRTLRGIERGDLQRVLPAMAATVRRALDLPESECPVPPQRELPGQLTVLGQFLSTALGSICRAAEVAPSMVGTSSDVRDLVAYLLKLPGSTTQSPPSLARGWRAEVVGNVIEELLAGRIGVRISDPMAEEPLAFERLNSNRE